MRVFYREAVSHGKIPKPRVVIFSLFLIFSATMVLWFMNGNSNPPLVCYIFEKCIKVKSIKEKNSSLLLPKKIISVIGLEASGTRFLTSILAKAHGLSKHREGSYGFDGLQDGLLVQHFSLPWGSRCECHPSPTIQNVVLPGNCSVPYKSLSPSCRAMAEDANMTLSHTGINIYPQRYFLDIVANKEWYESQGVQQVFVIVLRDQSISAKSRYQPHCKNEKLLEKEENIGTDIIIHAINKYIMGGGRRLSASSYETWYKETFLEEANNTNSDSNNLANSGHHKLSAALPSGNNVFLVSYESLMKLQDIYVKMMYQAMDIDSDYMPTFKDGNAKYVVGPTNTMAFLAKLVVLFCFLIISYLFLSAN